MTRIIGFTGVASSGKDTSADIFLSLIDGSKTFVRLSFAKPLKDAAKILWDLTDEQLYTSKKNDLIENDPWEFNGHKTSPRELLQWLGTDVLRKHMNEDFFAIHMEKQISPYLGKVDYILITDVRFDSEAKFIKKYDKSQIIHIFRPSLHKISLSNHSSENGISNQFIDNVIVNNGTLEDLSNKIELLI